MNNQCSAYVTVTTAAIVVVAAAAVIWWQWQQCLFNDDVQDWDCAAFILR
jgi:hypothetical protein